MTSSSKLDPFEMWRQVVTKLEGTAKVGIAVAVVRDLGVHIGYVGVGEAVEDLLPFDPAAYTDALIGS